jgi:HSP20 family protein
MRLVRYNPFNKLALLGNSFDAFFPEAALTAKNDPIFYPVVDISDEDDTVVLTVELPGIKKQDIRVNIENTILTIQGEKRVETEEKKETYFQRERSYGEFKRSFSLSDDVVTDEVMADYKDGVLKITLKKNKAKNEIKQITVH